MDCTYKTNRFNMPLLSICGISPLSKSFQVAAVLLEGEKEEQFTWALEALTQYYREAGVPSPKVILTDRDLGLMNALAACQISRDIPHLLCGWHVNMNILAKTKRYFPKATRQPDGQILRHQDFHDFLKA
jgi:MULE transposase-like protein